MRISVPGSFRMIGRLEFQNVGKIFPTPKNELKK